MNKLDANRAKTMDNFKVHEPQVAPMVWWFIHSSSTAIISYMYIDKLIDNVIYQSTMNVRATNKYQDVNIRVLESALEGKEYNKCTICNF
jgi:hypothetical protein